MCDDRHCQEKQRKHYNEILSIEETVKKLDRENCYLKTELGRRPSPYLLRNRTRNNGYGQGELLGKEYILSQAKSYKKTMTAIYFLIKAGEIVYIGQSKNVYKRINEHKQKGKFRFSSYALIVPPSMEQWDILLEERRYIARYNPIYNIRHSN